jgi:hypothetical protein
MIEVGSNWTDLCRAATIPRGPTGFSKLPQGTLPKSQNGSLPKTIDESC